MCSFFAFCGFTFWTAICFFYKIAKYIFYFIKFYKNKKKSSPDSDFEVIKTEVTSNARSMMLEYKITHILITGIVLGSIISLFIFSIYMVTKRKEKISVIFLKKN